MALVLLVACGGAPVSAPSQDVAIASAPSASAAPCPEGTRREGALCVGKVDRLDATCATGQTFVAGRGCVVDARRAGGAWARPTPLSPPDVALARRRFQRGVELYAAGDYEAALAELDGAYAASAAPAVLYNIGSCLERLGRLDEAIDAFEAYLAEAPSPRDEVRGRIDELRRKLGR